MYAVSAPLPEFKPMRHQSETAPMLRPSRFDIGELSNQFPSAAFEDRPIRNFTTLIRCERGETRRERSLVEVFIQCRVAQRMDSATDSYLTFELKPAEQTLSLIIGRQLLTLLAFIVRIEGQAAGDKTTAQHSTLRSDGAPSVETVARARASAL